MIRKEGTTILSELDQEEFHVTCVMHNTRTSQRMIDYNVKKGKPEYLSLKEEAKLIEIICQIIKEEKLKILALNLCADHLHFAIVCNPANLTKIVGKLKSKSARAFNIWRGVTIPIMGHAQPTANTPTMGHAQQTVNTQTMGHAPLTDYPPLTDHAPLTDHSPLTGHAPLTDSPALTDTPPSTIKTRGKTQHSLWAQKFHRVEIKTTAQLHNVIEYITNNRIKHQLHPLKPETTNLINSVIISCDDAFIL
jgi:REP element-mobilizing transposase RayT